MRTRMSAGRSAWATRISLASLATLAILAGAGCHPGEIDNIEELDVVITFHDETVGFGAFATYAMEDTIYNLAVLQDPNEDDTLDRRFDADIIVQVKSEMAGRGYTLVDTSAAHDLRLGLGAFDVEGTAIYTYYPWWGYSPGAWYPAWNSVDFTKGSLLVFLADWAGRDQASGEIDAVWTGGLDGILEDDVSSLASRIERGIAQMYTQSPYLQSDVTKSGSREVQR